jgi:hypothetical protein
MCGGRSTRRRTTPVAAQEAVALAKAVGAAGVTVMSVGDECRRCGKIGHWAHECHSKHRKEQVHVTQDEEETSLMLTTAP